MWCLKIKLKRIKTSGYRNKMSKSGLAEVSKLVPKGVICLVSALAFMTLPTRYRAGLGSRSALVIGRPKSAIRQSARYGFANAISPQPSKPIKFAASTCRFIRLPNRLRTLSAIRNALIGP